MLHKTRGGLSHGRGRGYLIALALPNAPANQRPMTLFRLDLLRKERPASNGTKRHSACPQPTFCPPHYSSPYSGFQQQPFLTLTIVHRTADLTVLARMPAPETCMCQQADPPGLNAIRRSGDFDKVKCTKKSVNALFLQKARPESIDPSPPPSLHADSESSRGIGPIGPCTPRSWLG